MGYTINARITPRAAVKLLISNEIDTEASLAPEQAAAILHELSVTDVVELLKIIDTIDPLDQVDSLTLPQFGSLETLLKVPEILISLGFDCLSYIQLGFYLKGDVNAKPSANAKYGETHGKGACQLGYARCHQNRVCFSPFTSAICSIDDKDLQHRLTALLCLRIPIIQTLLHRAQNGAVNGYEPMSHLEFSTQKRRAICVRMILKELGHLENPQLSFRINNIVWTSEEDE